MSPQEQQQRGFGQQNPGQRGQQGQQGQQGQDSGSGMHLIQQVLEWQQGLISKLVEKLHGPAPEHGAGQSSGQQQ